jgi:DNA primase
MFLPEGHDPDSYVNEFGTDAFLKALDEGLALSEFLIQELAGQVDMSTVDGRARLAELARPLVNRIPQGVYRELLVESLAEAVGLTAAKLEKMLSSDKSSGPSAYVAGGSTKSRSRKPAAGQPSVIRHAITMLLNDPAACLKLDIEKLAGVNRAGVELLRALIETVQAEPNISTAGILERWRHHEEGRHLGKLVASEVPMDDDFDAAAELDDCLEQLETAGRKERISFLIEKQRVNGLSAEEKAELQELLKAA